MVEKRAQRRLAAILAADIVGYSRLMEHDETGTLTALKARQHDVLAPVVALHHGRIVKLMGDGVLVEFGSAVDAVQCAVELQKDFNRANQGVPETRQIVLRIGINLGDVIVEGKDIYGDGVNVAARLEGLADPGGVLISGTAFDQVERKLDYGFEFLGEQQVKNIEKPVRLYRIGLRAHAATAAASAEGKNLHARRWLAVTAAALTLVVGGAALWINFQGSSIPPNEVASKARMVLPLPDKPSIAVLPFTNMSDDAGEQHFADGMTDSLITDLSKFSGLFIIARNSTFAYQGKSVKISQVAEELGVHYVLEGSVQRAGDKLRVKAQLIDALTGGHLWADRFDGNVVDVFAVQDAFVSKIVKAMEVTFTIDEREQIAHDKTTNVAAKDAFDEGWSHYLRFNAKDNAAAVIPLKRAIELDPEYGRAFVALALVYFIAYDYQWQQELGMTRQELLNQGNAYLAIAKKHPTALYFVANAVEGLCAGNGEDARRQAGRAISLDPNDPEAHIAMAWALIISGEPKEALNFVATAMRLNPSHPAHYVFARGIAFFAANEIQQAAQVLEEGLQRNPQATALLGTLASTLAMLGRRKEARQMLQNWLQGADQRGLDNWIEAYAFPFKWEPKHQGVQERLYDGLRLAALPLDITVASLIIELKGNNPPVQMTAAKRLGWFGPEAKAAIPALEAIQNERHVGGYASDALRKIRGN